VDIETGNILTYGAEEGFGKRIFIVYDGTHYDGEVSHILFAYSS